jgi:hypothetical protein
VTSSFWQSNQGSARYRTKVREDRSSFRDHAQLRSQHIVSDKISLATLAFEHTRLFCLGQECSRKLLIFKLICNGKLSAMPRIVIR